MKPDDIPQDVWESGRAVVHAYCGCAPGRSRANGTSHHDQCWRQVEAHARSILSERDRCAKVAERKWRGAPMYPDGTDIAVDIRTGEQP